MKASQSNTTADFIPEPRFNIISKNETGFYAFQLFIGLIFATISNVMAFSEVSISISPLFGNLINSALES
jgi:hypothetical protein